MAEQRRVFRVGHSLVVALPPEVQEHVGVKRGQAVYWSVVRGGEAVISVKQDRRGGRPEGLALKRELAAARAEVERLKQRNDARDRSMYAEGYNVGYLKAQERLTAPVGRSAERQRRREVYRYAFGAGPRPVERRRKSETVPGPDQYVAPVSPDTLAGPSLPDVSQGEASAPGAARPQADP